MSLVELKEIPKTKVVLLVGPPGVGKSTFCQQTVLSNLVMERPVIFVTTEYGTLEAERYLKKRGLTGASDVLLKYVDGFNQTVGLPLLDRSDTINVSSGNLTYLGIAIFKHQRNIGKKGILLVFDSLTSSYLLCGSEVVRFFRLTLSRFAGDGNSVLVCFDEGSSKEEDLVGMMSICDGLVKLNIKADSRVYDIVKHPRMKPAKIETPSVPIPPGKAVHINMEYLKENVQLNMGLRSISLRKEVGDYVNIAWRDLLLWSGMLWDPKRFPMMIYDWIKFHYNLRNRGIDYLSFMPWQKRIALKFLKPKSLSKVKDMKRAFKAGPVKGESVFRTSKVEYLEELSKTDEHYFRHYENYECWGFNKVGTSLALVRPAMTAVFSSLLDSEMRDWNIIETKCIGLGDPYCELKLVPGEINELKYSLEKDISVIEAISNRLMDYVLDFLLNGKPLMERPTLGSMVHIHDLQRISNASISKEEFQLVSRMGGAKAGKLLGERMMNLGLKEQEAVNHLVRLINHCKVGKITFDETIRIGENCERIGFKTDEPSCYFTTSFLNGFFYAVRNQQVRETKCIAAGDSYCEWELR
jgi:predicted hydrocarbon binding protein/KaiC/GvpD/RAD55 family RecA-like ATPase